jgi:hypothetical protein
MPSAASKYTVRQADLLCAVGLDGEHAGAGNRGQSPVFRRHITPRKPVTVPYFLGDCPLFPWTRPFRPEYELAADRDGARWAYLAGYVYRLVRRAGLDASTRQ